MPTPRKAPAAAPRSKPRAPAAADKPVGRLSDFLCFAIYSANLAFGRAYKTVLPKLGLTYPQYIALVALREQDGQTVNGLGSKLFLESNTLTPMLKKLEAEGFIERRRAKEDERQVIVSLTQAGRQLWDRADVDLSEATGLSPDEFARTLRSVVKMRDNLIRATGAEVAADQ